MNEKKNYSVNNLVFFEKLYNFMLWLFNHTDKIPRSKRYSLGGKIENIILNMLEITVTANMRKERKDLLNSISENLESLRILFRAMKDLKYININSYEYGSKELTELGKILGGWIKTAK